MAETADKVYKVKSDNTADTTPNSVAVISDGTGDRQIVVLGSGDGTTTIVDGTPANPQNTKLTDGTNTANVVAGTTINGLATATLNSVVNVGQKTVATTAVQLASGSKIPVNGIIVGALSTNSASIFIGGSGVTTSTGAELTPGSSLPFTCNLNTLYIISAASSSDVVWFNCT